MEMSPTQCKLYLYAPSLPMALVAIIIFSVLTTAHVFRMTRAGTWSGIYFVFGGVAQISGYTARLFSTQNPCDRVAYAIQSVLLLMGPTLIMFSVNLTMTEFTRALRAERFCWVPFNLQRPLYLSINTVLALVQAIGGILTAASTNFAIIITGTKMGIAIFVIQLVFWLFTFAENTYITIRLRRELSETTQSAFPTWKYWCQLFGLAVSIIAFGRNIVRLTMNGGIEFLIVNEWPSYAFDGYQMAIVLGAWAIWYLPGKCRDVSEKMSHTISLSRLHTRGSEDSGDSTESRTQRRHNRMQRREDRLRGGRYEAC